MKKCSQKRAPLTLQLVRDLMNAVLTLLKRRRKNYLFAVTHFIHTYTSKKYPKKEVSTGSTSGRLLNSMND